MNKKIQLSNNIIPSRYFTQMISYASAAVFAGVLISQSAVAADCRYESTAPLPGGVQPPLLVNDSCTDPDFNENNFVIDEVKTNQLLPAPFTQIPYTQVKVRFLKTKTAADLAAQGYTAGGPQTVDQPATFFFPEARNFHNRFFQHLYPLPQSISNVPGQLAPNLTSDLNFAMTSGGFYIDSEPANQLVGYRVDAAFAKMAKKWAQENLYGVTGQIYGYVWGGSGGSFQTEGAVERTVGVWHGAIPYVTALSGLTSTGGMQLRLFQMRVPLAKQQTIAKAVQPGSGLDPFDGLTSEESAALLELLRFGYPLRGFQTAGFQIILFGDGRQIDPTYEEDFWSKPGYAGKDFPAYVQAALVDTYVTITNVTTNAQGQKVLTLDGAPTPGSVGLSGLEHYVYLADSTTRVRGATEATSVLAGTRNDTSRTFTVAATSDPALVGALQIGAKLRINNRYYIAVAHYPRHVVPSNGNIQYAQYKNADGTPIYPQRPVDATQPAGTRTSGGVVADGSINFKTIVVTNQLDVNTFHLSGPAYAKMVQNSLGKRKANQMFRIYHQDNADHFDNISISSANSNRLVTYVPMLYQALRDLSAWVEKGTPPPPSTRYDIDDGQVVLRDEASTRKGIQPVVDLRVSATPTQGKWRGDHNDCNCNDTKDHQRDNDFNRGWGDDDDNDWGGRDWHRHETRMDKGKRIVVAVGQQVTLCGSIAVPPRTGRVVSYDWYLGGNPVVYEPQTALQNPMPFTKVQRTVTFNTAGTYFVSLRATSQRKGIATDPTAMQNLDRVQIVVQ